MRAALVDTDASAALMLGLSADQLCLMYRAQFPVLRKYEYGMFFDAAGRKIANPIAAIWSGALMLEHLGHAEAAADIVRAIETVIVQGPHTADMKGRASTPEVGAAVAEALRAQSKIAA